MKHNRQGRKLNRTASHRKAMLRNMVTSLFAEERITTTTAKAKEARRLAERMITFARRGDLSARRHVARFVGMENIIEGTVVSCEQQMAVIEVGNIQIEAVKDCSPGGRVAVCMRPEDVTVARQRFSSSARNSVEGTVSWMQTSGPLCRVEIDCGFPLIALVTRRSSQEMGLDRGEKVVATFKAVSIHVINLD